MLHMSFSVLLGLFICVFALITDVRDRELCKHLDEGRSRYNGYITGVFLHDSTKRNTKESF